MLARVLVYRGLPSPEHDAEQYARNLAQKAHWERDSRVRVTSRPLKYDYERDASGRRVLDAGGRPITVGRPREKGIDVLCALAVVREAASPTTDLVVLASRDSDLRPALDEALHLGTAKIETTTWHDPLRPGQCRPLQPDDEKRRLWNTRMSETEFQRTLDRRDYT
ncbi:MAG TPA: NYN domain-containing protein [Mycobacteriales bacterium]|nr:NYN domain-containing protein [Mycobacteriales bacterium]